MRNVVCSHWLFTLLLILLSTFFFLGVAKVPFHPDESTYIFMSADFERILTNPLSMTWEGGKPITDIYRYRMIDAPLTRYLLGIGRFMAGLPALSKDWDWSTTWEVNKRLGALPNKTLLLIERFTIASLFPLCLFLLYLIGLKLDGRLLGITTILIFSLHPLILLHTRRAMAEGMLIFGLILTLYAFTIANKKALFTGIAVALAINAKHSAIILIPIGLLAVIWFPKYNPRKPSNRLINISGYLLGLILISTLLNPIIWRTHITTAREAITQRQILINRQVADISSISPTQVLESPSERAAVLLVQLFIAPPIFSEVGNYRLQTSLAEKIYLDTPGNNLWRNSISAGIMLGLTLLGMFNSIQISLKGDSIRRRIIILFLLSFLVMLGGIILMIPLAWQRYSLPMIPIVSIFTSMGVVWGINTSSRIFTHGRLSSRLSQILTQLTPDSWMP
jgi:4-amino-4-deoxy-L-arabinose transferase-like glycosyltransferase